MIASTANAVEMVLEILTLTSGNSPVRISHNPNKSIPRLLLLKPLFRSIVFLL